MGIKDLWPILEPFSERKSLYELEGKIVAIDLSGWICDSQNVVEYSVLPNMFLRNLFFRSCCLLMIGVIPVFVLEGDAPSIKLATLNKRNEIQFKGCKPRKPQNFKINEETSRKGFNVVLQKCKELLNSLGLSYVQGSGEAEAFCAYLNECQHVDGIISQDSDCFAYGALKVYRNFCVSQQGTQGGSVDIYDLQKIRQVKNLGRNHIISLALLCGCDYCPEGVGGVGKDAALKLIGAYEDDRILNRIRAWRTDNVTFANLEKKVTDKSVCTQCGHKGHLRRHVKSGCDICTTVSGCNITKYREELLLIKNELAIRKKALENAQFPNEDIIEEFLKKPGKESNLDLGWKMPSMPKFISIMNSVLEWNEIYCFQKFLPILTRWQLKCNKTLNDKNSHFVLKADKISKRRKIKGVASYEIIWKDETGAYSNIIPNDQLMEYYECNTRESLWSTIEPEELVRQAYPSLITNYEESEILKKKNKRVKCGKDVPRKKTNLQSNISADDGSHKKETISIKHYFKLQKKTNHSSKSQDRVNITTNSTSTSDELLHDKDDLLSQVGSDSDSELDLSNVIQNITCRPGVLAEPIILQCRAKEDKIPIYNEQFNNSFFFDNHVESDGFELTFDKLTNVSSVSDPDALNSSNDNVGTSPNSSPKHKYVSLIDRIKEKHLVH